MSEQYDDLDAYIAKRTTKNPAFPAMVDAVLKEHRLLCELAAKWVEMGLPQKAEALGQSIAVIPDTDLVRENHSE